MNTCLVVLNYNDAINSLNVINYGIDNNLFSNYVVVDNCSSEQDKKMLVNKLPDQVVLIENDSNLGYSIGHNIGLKYAVSNFESDYIFIIVSDIIYNIDCVRNCLCLIERNEDIGAISCRIKNVKGEEEESCWKYPTYMEYVRWCYPFFRIKKNINDYPLRQDESSFDYVDVIRGSFMCFRKEALVCCDYFDENGFLYNEENIISMRLKKCGYKMAVVRDCYYIHNHVNKEYIKKNTFKDICESASSGPYFMKEYCGIYGLKYIILKISTFFLCVMRYIKNI